LLIVKSTNVSWVTGPFATSHPSTANTLRGIAFSCKGMSFCFAYLSSMKFSVALQSTIAVVWWSLLSHPRIVTLSISFSSLLYGPVLEILYGVSGDLGSAAVVCPRSPPLTSTPGVVLFPTVLPVVLLHMLPLLPGMSSGTGWVSWLGIVLHNVPSCHNCSIRYSFDVSLLWSGS
jgi:hypothetical protein